MNFIENYYYIIIGIGLFIMFALLGYLIEIIKKNKEIKKSEDKENSDKNNEVNNNGKIEPVVIENKSEEVSIDNDILNK